jgi:hypothetical protein
MYEPYYIKWDKITVRKYKNKILLISTFLRYLRMFSVMSRYELKYHYAFYHVTKSVQYDTNLYTRTYAVSSELNHVKGILEIFIWLFNKSFLT